MTSVLDTILRWLRRRRAPPAEKPLRDELLSIERLEERAKALAARLTVDPTPRRNARDLFPRFDDNARVLRGAYLTMAEDVHKGEFVTAAAEWLLDNYHLVASEIRDVRQNLPRAYYRELPKLATRELAGDARVYAMAVELIRHSDSRLDRPQLLRFMNSYQTVAPLTIGELWAWPSMLKLALIENLRRLAEEATGARDARRAADDYVAQIDAAGHGRPPPLPPEIHPAFVVQLLQRVREYGPRLSAVRAAVDAHLAAQRTAAEEAIRSEHQSQAAAQVSVANVITSLRLLSTLDWSQYFESVSLVEGVLQRDPATVYGRMDFLSRDRYRQAVEDLADGTGESQLRVALRTVESARQAAESGVAGRAVHVGHHLIGKGRADLETDVAYRPRLLRRARRFLFAHATAAYLGTIVLLTAMLLGLGFAYAHERSHSPWPLAWVALLLLLPASDVAIAVVQSLCVRFAAPRRLPRLDFLGGVPESARTMVVVPTLLTSVERVGELLEHLEVLALGNLDPCVHFALLGDFADAPAREMPQDEAILSAARAGIEALNARHAEGRSDRFYLAHRVRQWNPGEGVWMGWERKRGKIEEWNRILRGATDTSFTVEAGDASVFPAVRYCITLDSDTRLPRDAAKKLIGIAAHPLNQAHFDLRLGRVTEGYGILQPRVSVTMASAAGSLFARLYAGHTGVDPYTTAVSDTYQDLFAEGIFTGKGLYDVDAFIAALEGRVPENALLSHDLFEGLYARTALVTDIEVVDDYPASVLAHARRQHRWVRGDWQILWWLFPVVPTRSGLRRNQLPLISRWKILDNLRRSLMAPATVALLLLAWTVLPGSPLLWTAAVLAALAFNLYPLALTTLGGPPPQQPWRVFLRVVREDANTALAQTGLQLTFLASQAWERVHAIGLTLVRLTATQSRMLEWETAAASADRGRHRTGAGSFVRAMIASPLIALLGLALVALARPTALAAALPVLVLWAAAPLVAHALSRPVPERRQELSPEDRAFLERVARDTWRYFEDFMGPEHHGLPADNFQETPAPRVAQRTSPTNIGMGLLATLAAHDLGFIATGVFAERVDATLTTMEGLERHEGHLLNWYDTQTLAALPPRYVSTVDSGNLAGALMALAEGLRQAGLDDLAGRAASFAEGMGFRFLYDPQRRILSIGYRLADVEGPGRLDVSYYDLLASEARLASFIAIARGELPETHWFHLGRLVTSVHGTPTLLSWSGTAFEYLMPLLVMKSYPDTLLDQSCRMAVRRQAEYAAGREVPWGISECAYNLGDRQGNYQYKAFGVPGLGLKRGLADELVVAPYATALAAMVEPQLAVRNLRRLSDEGRAGSHGYYEAIDYTHGPVGDLPAGESPAPSGGTVVRAFMAHHQGMTLVSLANVLLGDLMVKRFHADPRVQATELLLQERVPRAAAITQPRPVEETRVAGPAPAQALRRFRSPHTLWPHAQFLSNGSYTTVVTNSGGGASFCRDRVVTRHREDATRDPGSQFIYLRDVRSGDVWSATYHPTRTEPEDYVVTFLAEKATFALRHDAVASHLDVAVSTEDDVEVRRLALTNHSARERDRDHELRRDRPRPGGGRPGPPRLREAVRGDGVPPGENGAAVRPSAALGRRGGAVGRARAQPRRPHAGPSRVGDGPLAIPRPRALDGRSPGSRRTLSLRHDGCRARPRGQLAPARPHSARGLRAAVVRHGHGALARHGPGARAEVPRAGLGGTDLRPRPGARAERAAAPRHHERGRPAVRAAGVARAVRRSLAARGPGDPGPQRARPGRPLASRHLGRPPAPPRAGGRGGRSAARPRGPPGPGVLEAQGAACRRRDPERAPRRLSRRDARPADGAPRQRPVAGVEPPARRALPAPRRPHGRSRAGAARLRGAGRAQRRSGRPLGAARARLRLLARAGAARPRALTAAGSGRRVRRGSRGATSRPGQRPGRLRRGRSRLRGAARRRREHPDAVGERDRQSGVRHRGHRRGVRLHVGREQPREPHHALRERPRQRPDGGGSLRP